MNCKDVRRYLSDYIDGFLEPERVKEFEEHLKTCNECRILINEVSSIRSKVSRLPVPELNPYLFQGIKHRVENEKIGIPFRMIYRIAMGMSFILVVFALVFHLFRPSYNFAERKKELYIIKEEKTGYQFPVYTVKDNYVLTSYRGGTF